MVATTELEWVGHSSRLAGENLDLLLYNGRYLLNRAAEAYHTQVLLAFEETEPPTINQVKATLADGLAMFCERILMAIVNNKPFPTAEYLADLLEDLLITKIECDRQRASAKKNQDAA